MTVTSYPGPIGECCGIVFFTQDGLVAHRKKHHRRATEKQSASNEEGS